jgi:hypothetical protein
MKYEYIQPFTAYEQELQMVQLSATRCSCIATLWVRLVNFAAITLCIASQRVFIVVSVYFAMDSVRKLLDTPSYNTGCVRPWSPTARSEVNVKDARNETSCHWGSRINPVTAPRRQRTSSSWSVSVLAWTCSQNRHFNWILLTSQSYSTSSYEICDTSEMWQNHRRPTSQ